MKNVKRLSGIHDCWPDPIVNSYALSRQIFLRVVEDSTREGAGHGEAERLVEQSATPLEGFGGRRGRELQGRSVVRASIRVQYYFKKCLDQRHVDEELVKSWVEWHCNFVSVPE